MTIPQENPYSRTIMDDSAVQRIKTYIERKHPDFTSAQRAKVFANAVHRIIDQHLPDFGEELKVRLRQELLAKMGMEQRFTLLTGDILKACRELELEESGLAQLALWMDRHQLPVQAGGLEAEEVGAPLTGSVRRSYRTWRAAGIAVLMVALAAIAASSLQAEAPRSALALIGEAGLSAMGPPSLASPAPVLPGDYAYHAMDQDKLKLWLAAKQSLLAEEPYFSAILAAAEEYNIHPLLLFAITGQEQGYVPKERKQSEKIANNPFNVYHSWKSYNTDIGDSARIASKTIISISKSRPADVHPIMWLNTKYAEDPNWWVGVNAIFEKMRRDIPLALEVKEHPDDAHHGEEPQKENLE